MDRATSLSKDKLFDEFRSTPLEAWVPVQRQLRLIWEEVNRARKAAGFEPLSKTVLPKKKVRVVRAFEPKRRAA